MRSSHYNGMQLHEYRCRWCDAVPVWSSWLDTTWCPDCRTDDLRDATEAEMQAGEQEGGV